MSIGPVRIGRSDLTVLGHDTIRYYFVGITRFHALRKMTEDLKCYSTKIEPACFRKCHDDP